MGIWSNRTKFYIQQQKGRCLSYCILDRERSEELGFARETQRSKVTWYFPFRFRNNVQLGVMQGRDTTPHGVVQPVLQITKSFNPRGFCSEVFVRDENNELLCCLKSRPYILGGAFRVFDEGGALIGNVKGDAWGRVYRLFDRKNEILATIEKKWEGIGREVLASADNYLLSLCVEPGDEAIRMSLAVVFAIDVVFHE